MTEKEYKETIKRLNEINDEQATVIRHLNKRIMEMEEMDKAKRLAIFEKKGAK